jgi:hypothetical protein
LTNEWIYTMSGLASRFLGNQDLSASTTVDCIEIQAVDASVAFDRWLLIVMPDGSVRYIEIEQLASMNDEAQTQDMTPVIQFGCEESLLQYELTYATAS